MIEVWCISLYDIGSVIVVSGLVLFLMIIATFVVRGVTASTKFAATSYSLDESSLGGTS
jgi:hypothetical protein